MPIRKNNTLIEMMRAEKKRPLLTKLSNEKKRKCYSGWTMSQFDEVNGISTTRFVRLTHHLFFSLPSFVGEIEQQQHNFPYTCFSWHAFCIGLLRVEYACEWRWTWERAMSEFELWRQKPFILWKFDIETRFKLLDPIPNSAAYGVCVIWKECTPQFTWFSESQRMQNRFEIFGMRFHCFGKFPISHSPSQLKRHIHLHMCVLDGLAYSTSNHDLI